MFTDEWFEDFEMSNSKSITIINQNKLFVEDIQKIVSVSSEEITIRLSSKTILFVCGSCLEIKKLEPKTCQISGAIQSLNFGEKNDKK